MTRIAVIGAGAMGAGVGRRLAERGCEVPTLLDGRSEATRQRAAEAGMTAAGLEDIASAQVILSIVPPAQAAAVVETLAPVFASGHAPLFCDANALAPETKQRLAARVAELGGQMVDGGIIGSPPRSDYDGPRLFVCGDGAGAMALLNDYGVDTRILPGPLSAAAALKMCYAGINKGVIGLVTAMLLAAERHGAAAELLEELAVSQRPLLERMRTAVPSMFPKAYRWDAEMHEIAAFLFPDDPSAASIWTGMGAFYTDRARPDAQRGEPRRLKDLLG